jgi:hypothetical protein
VFLKSNSPQINTDEKDGRAFLRLFLSSIRVYLRSSATPLQKPFYREVREENEEVL